MLFPDRNPIISQLFWCWDEQPGRGVGFPWDEPSEVGAGAGAEPDPPQTPPILHPGGFHIQSIWGISLSCSGLWSWIHPKGWRLHTKLLSLLCPLDGSPASTLTFLCVFLPSFPQEFQAGLRSPGLFPPEAGRDGLGLSQSCVPRAGGSAGWLLCPFPAVPVPALPLTRRCPRPAGRNSLYLPGTR